ncbi:hypothetical protein E3N88_36944 [Mikania micrantha]|uniref:Uncharacterized protein n=1 Tax=Mikania micrantha TaxID=192012 RepID=A0A5N6M592_9ASTR|nr:hypothetical protein E3N88_36944 [Mikania micrantha]
MCILRPQLRWWMLQRGEGTMIPKSPPVQITLYTVQITEERKKEKKRDGDAKATSSSKANQYYMSVDNSFGCSASDECLVSAARDDDFVEPKMLQDRNPCLAKYSTFGRLNSPLHFTAAKGHNGVRLHGFFFLILCFHLIFMGVP